MAFLAARAAQLFDLCVDLTTSLLDMLYPGQCVGCNRDGPVCCRSCQTALIKMTREPPKPLQLQCASTLQLTVHSGANYIRPGKELLLAFKQHDKPQLAAVLGKVLQLRLAQLGFTQNTVFIPLPSRKQRVKERGYNHLTLLMRSAGIPQQQISNLLQATPTRSSQVGLNARERALNAARLQIAPAHLHKLSGKEIVLIDDVTTTGSSLKAAAIALNQQGINCTKAVTLFAVQHSSDSQHAGVGSG